MRGFAAMVIRGNFLGFWALVWVCLPLRAHHDTRPEGPREIGLADASRQPLVVGTPNLSLRWADGKGGLVRVTPQGGTEALALPGLFERPAGWHSMPGAAELVVPAGNYRIESTRGISAGVREDRVEVGPSRVNHVSLEADSFVDPGLGPLRAVNTHLHLLLRARLKMGVDLISRDQADAYLRTVGESDDLDLVYVSYLTQAGLEIVSNDYTADDLRAFSSGATRFVDGIEHRHGGVRVTDPGAPRLQTGKETVYTQDNSRVAMSYGHVLLLGLDRHRVTASLGPGMSDEPAATDGTPLRDGLRQARADGGAVVWCHGSQGAEWIPSWVGGWLHAQNIYDGGTEGTFETVHYPLLNAGLRVPFSTGSDWGVWDFSRVMVDSREPLTHAGFLQALAAGRAYITNEPLLEFTVEHAHAGDTLALAAGRSVRVRGRAMGRSDFIRLQLVYNGRVVHETSAHRSGGHHQAELNVDVPLTEPGWLALRVPPEKPYTIRSRYAGPGVNLFGKAIFAHTSPVYVTIAGRGRSERAAVEALSLRLEAALAEIDQHGRFRDQAERDALRRLYLEARENLRARLETRQ